MSKSKYPLDQELKCMEGQQLFPCIYVYPLVNLFIGRTTCRSDDKVVVKEYETPGYDNYMLKTLILEPRDTDGILPCIVFFHGGGIMLKAVEAHYQFAKWYVEKTRCKVVITDYRLMPRYRYPYATMDCYRTYEWVIDHADELQINKNRIIFTGDSAGATLSAAVSFMARDNNLTMPIGVLMSYPALDRRMNTESMKRYTDTPVLNSKLAGMYWNEYLRNATPTRPEYASPLEADSFDKFPSTYIEVAEFDCLHDDGVLFAEKLKSANIPVELNEVPGACHGFEVVLDSRIVHEALDRRVSWINRLIL